MLTKLAALAVLAATPALAETVTVNTALGPVDVDQSPASVVTFDISAADTLDALGLTAVGVPSPTYLDYLDDFAAGAEAVGTLFEPDYEALAALGPALIIAGGRSAGVVSDLNGIAPTLDMTIGQDAVGDALTYLDAYGKIWDKEAEAAALAEALNAKLTAAKDAMADEGTVLMVMTNGPKVSAYGTSGRFGWIFTALELTEAVENVEEATHGEAISFEFIRDANPDVLIVLDRLAAIGQEGDSAEATLDNALVHETEAWKNGKVIYVDGARTYIAAGGAQALMHTFDQFTETFGD